MQGDVYTYIHVVASLAEHKHKYEKLKYKVVYVATSQAEPT